MCWPEFPGPHIAGNDESRFSVADSSLCRLRAGILPGRSGLRRLKSRARVGTDAFVRPAFDLSSFFQLLPTCTQNPNSPAEIDTAPSAPTPPPPPLSKM